MAGGRTGIRAGRAYVELGADDKLTAALRRASMRLRAFGQGVQSMGRRLSMFGGAALTGLGGAAKVFSSMGDEVAKMAKRTGMSVEALSEMRFVASQTGTDFESLEKAFRKMQRSIYDAGRGLSTQTEALSDLGLGYKDLAGLMPEEQFKRIADALGRVEDPTRKAAIAMAVFGRTGTNLLPMFEQGARGIDRLQSEARRLGLTMSGEDAAAAERFTDAMDVLGKVVRMSTFRIGAALAPTLEKLAERITSVTARASKWIAQNGETVVSILKITAAVTGLGLALSVLGKTLTIAAAAIAHPFIAGAVAVGALATALSVAKGKTVELADAARSARRESDAQRQADLDRMERLKRLAEKQELSNAELGEARRLLALLEGRYGDLSVEIDEAAGKITGMAEAQERLNKAMREGALLDLQAEIVEYRENLRQLRNQAGKIEADFRQRNIPLDKSRAKDTGSGAQDWVDEWNPWSDEKYRERYRQLTAAIRAALLRLEAAQRRFNALQSGAITREELTGTPAGGGGLDVPRLDAVREAGETEEEWARRVYQMRLQLIEDEHRRELALINERYDHEIEQAKKANATKRALELIEQARRLAIEKLLQDRTRREDEERRGIAQRAAEMDASRTERIEELELRTKYDGDELEMQLLLLQYKRAMQEAIATGGDTELVTEEYRLLAELMGKLAEARETMAGANKATVRGTFNAEAVEGWSAGSTVDRLAKAAEDTAKTNEEIARNTSRMGAKFTR